MIINSLIVRVVAAGSVFSVATFAADRELGILHSIVLPAWVEWALAILALDFAVYLQHVMFHAVPVFWRLHRVHHADLVFDASTGVRFHPIEILISIALKSAVVLLVGAAPWAVAAFEILLNASSVFNHGNVAIAEFVDRWLRRMIVTPDMHRVHHSNRVVETNSNFGFSFSFWDRLCGTYRPQPSMGQLGLEIGLLEYPQPLHLGQLLVLPFRGRAGAYPFAGARPAEAPNLIQPSELREQLSQPEPPIVVDVRNPDEYTGELGHIDGSVLVPLPDLETRLADLGPRRGKTIVPV